MKAKTLKSLFTQFGTVQSVRLRSVPIDGEGKMPKQGKVITKKLVEERKSTNGYVVFVDAKAVQKAVAEMNMRAVEGRHLRVDAAAAPSSRANEAKAKELSKDLPPGVGITNGGEVNYDHARSLFLGNLAYDVDEEDVISFFHKSKEYPDLAGSVEAVRIVRDRSTNLGKGIAFVLFRKTGDARTGLLLDGNKMGERKVRVTRASKNRAAFAAAASAKRQKREEDVRPSGAQRRLRTDDDKDDQVALPIGWEGSRSRPGGKQAKTAFDGGAAAGGGGRGGGRDGGGGRGGGGWADSAAAAAGSARPRNQPPPGRGNDPLSRRERKRQTRNWRGRNVKKGSELVDDSEIVLTLLHAITFLKPSSRSVSSTFCTAGVYRVSLTSRSEITLPTSVFTDTSPLSFLFILFSCLRRLRFAWAPRPPLPQPLPCLP